MLKKTYFNVARLIAITSSQIDDIIKKILRDHNLSPFSFWILEALKDDRKITPTEICEITGGKNANVSRRLDDLLKKELVRQCENQSKDRRKNFFQITPRGKKILEKIGKNTISVESHFEKNFDIEELKQMEKIFAKMRKIINEIENEE